MFEGLKGLFHKDKSQNQTSILQESGIESIDDIDLENISNIDFKDLPKEIQSGLDLDDNYEVTSVDILPLGAQRKAYLVHSQSKSTPELNRQIEIIDNNLNLGELGRIRILMPSQDPNHRLYSENAGILWTQTPDNLKGKGLAPQRLILANAVSQKYWQVPLISSTIMHGRAPERTWEKLHEKGLVEALPKISEFSRQRYVFKPRNSNE